MPGSSCWCGMVPIPLAKHITFQQFFSLLRVTLPFLYAHSVGTILSLSPYLEDERWRKITIISDHFKYNDADSMFDF